MATQAMELRDIWSEDEIRGVQTRFVNQVFAAQNEEAVEAAVAFANYMRANGINEQNYPLFLKIFEIGNRVVVDALIGDEDPFLLLSPIKPSRYLLRECFHLLTIWNSGGIYPKTLSIVLGVLQIAYSYPRDGYRIYPATISDVNNLGKHLDKERGQADPVNRAILDILDRISNLMGTGDRSLENVARQAGQIRSHFFDNQRRMDDIIPQVLLTPTDYRATEVLPRTVFEA